MLTQKILVNSLKNDSNDKAKRKLAKCSRAVNLKRLTMDINFLTMESLILAQDERWRRALYMQVEREADFGQWKVADG